MSTRQLAIVNVGLVTSVGLNTANACAALRCRLNNFTELDYDDQDNEPVIGAPVPWGDMGSGIEKLAYMAGLALRQVLALYPNLDASNTPLILCSAEKQRIGRITDLDDALFTAIGDQFGHYFHADSVIIRAGQPATTAALKHARELLYDKHHQAVLIVAADTLLNRNTIMGSLEQERLLATDIRAGFIPGEAAGAMLVTRPDKNLDVQLLVFGIGTAKEAATIDSDLPLHANGLTKAIKAGLKEADASAEEIACCIADVSGEEYYFDELALVVRFTK